MFPLKFYETEELTFEVRAEILSRKQKQQRRSNMPQGSQVRVCEGERVKVESTNAGMKPEERRKPHLQKQLKNIN